MNQDLLESALQSLNLTPLDIRIYLTISEKGLLSISQLARILGVERLTIYGGLERLQDIGLVPVNREKYARGIIVEPPSQVYALLEKKRTQLFYQSKDLEMLLPNLMTAFAEKNRLSAFRLFEGKEQFLTIFEEALRENGDTICFYGDAQTFVDYVTVEYENSWVKKRVRRKINLKMLVFPTEYIEKRYKEIDPKELRQTRYIMGKPTFVTSFMVFGGKTLLWNPQAERAIVLDDPVMTQMFQYMFNNEWKVAVK